MEDILMRVFINYQLTNAFRVAQSRDKISAIKHMMKGGMTPIKATRFVEAMSQDIADTWRSEKAFCMVRKSNLYCSRLYWNGISWAFKRQYTYNGLRNPVIFTAYGFKWSDVVKFL